MIFINNDKVAGIRGHTYGLYSFWVKSGKLDRYFCSICACESRMKLPICPICGSIMNEQIDASTIDIPNYYCKNCFVFKYKDGKCDLCGEKMDTIYNRLLEKGVLNNGDSGQSKNSN